LPASQGPRMEMSRTGGLKNLEKERDSEWVNKRKREGETQTDWQNGKEKRAY
jgi:hypothetical protein